MLQNPEVKKKAKYQPRSLVASDVSPGRSTRGFGVSTFTTVGIVSVLKGGSVFTETRLCGLLCFGVNPKQCSLKSRRPSPRAGNVNCRHGDESHLRGMAGTIYLVTCRPVICRQSRGIPGSKLVALRGETVVPGTNEVGSYLAHVAAFNGRSCAHQVSPGMDLCAT